jgi:hypothetical protein
VRQGDIQKVESRIDPKLVKKPFLKSPLFKSDDNTGTTVEDSPLDDVMPTSKE